MRIPRLATIAAIALVGLTAQGATAGVLAPTNLHAFLLTVGDEPPAALFHQTPSFAWDPIPGAASYQFQLSTSDVFRENSIEYNTNSLLSPVVAPPLVLPWITGQPYGLYARVRATVVGGDVTPWSTPYGFNVTPPSTAPPTPLKSDPGLLRWTPVQGATSYQVWLIDVPTGDPGIGKRVTVRGNVLDEREFYTFHESTAWIGTVRWRIRAVRSMEAGGPTNGVPATSYSAWSSIYVSSNPAVTGGAITLLHTISDVTTGDDSATPHKLMPAFTWTGNQTISGASVELYRVYAFTDSACLNPVYVSPVVGSPAYAPRSGVDGISLPSDSIGIGNARSVYLSAGSSPAGEMADGTSLTSQEDLSASPTLTPPSDLNAGTDPGSSGDGATTGGTGTSSGGAPSSGTASTPAASAGTSFDLWDTDLWPKTGYYWTVVGVGPISAAASASTVAAPGASKGSTLVPVADVTNFSVGESITIGIAPDSDTAKIAAIGNGLITIDTPMNNGHAVGDPVSSTASSGIIYRDLELPQDVCSHRGATLVQDQDPRRGRFGIASEAALTSGQNIFATGLSPSGHLYSSAQTASFYGYPLIAWPTVLAADRYEVEWSTSAYPFVAAGQLMTPSTAVVLPVGTGTWYYRVRGFDDNLPSGSQMLSWSDTEELVEAGPTFGVVKASVQTFKIVTKTKSTVKKTKRTK